MPELPPMPPETQPVLAESRADLPTPLPMESRADGTLVIDLTRLAPPPEQDCAGDETDPLNPAIIVCQASGPSPRIGPMIGPVDDDFGSAIPRARIRLSDNASAEANAINKGVGGINANGGEVRLKIGF